MDTVVHIKTKKALKQRAEKLADSLGLTLTGLINLSLHQLVNSNELVINLREQPNNKTVKLLLKLKAEADKGHNLSPVFTDPHKALAWLHS